MQEIAQQRKQRISIHALLTESDWNRFTQRRDFKISIHALLTESDALLRDFLHH